jgi:Cu-Zn family superoxide dismutase
VSPSTDPAYANPDNEIWLDFTTTKNGSGLAVAQVDWRFTDRHAGSVVVHAEHTHTDPGHAGTAGARLACITVPF